MKLIIAIIQPYRLEEVKQALYEAEVNLITVSEVVGHGRQKGVTEVYRGVKEGGNLLRKIRLEIAVNENFVQPAINAITKGARTGETRRRQDLRAAAGALRADPDRRRGP